MQVKLVLEGNAKAASGRGATKKLTSTVAVPIAVAARARRVRDDRVMRKKLKTKLKRAGGIALDEAPHRIVEIGRIARLRDRMRLQTGVAVAARR